MKKNCCAGNDPARLNKVGGQAVIEGVMMKAGKRTVTTCRKDNGEMVVYDDEFVSVRKKHKILDLLQQQLLQMWPSTLPLLY